MVVSIVENKTHNISIESMYTEIDYSRVSIIRTFWFPRKIPDYRIFRIIEFDKTKQYFFNKMRETSYIKFAPKFFAFSITYRHLRMRDLILHY